MTQSHRTKPFNLVKIARLLKWIFAFREQSYWLPWENILALRSIRSILTFGFILVLIMTSIPNGPVQALSHGAINLPTLEVFISQLRNGHAHELRGVYIPDVLAARVVQQPEGNDGFVSPVKKVVTQFTLASKLGSIGLLAHNYLAGESFSLLAEGQKFYLIYGDGQVSAFMVTEILRYQAIESTNSLSEFVNLKNDELETASEVFAKVYNRPGQVVFQTCISADKDPFWGRLFVIAQSYYDSEYPSTLTPEISIHIHRNQSVA